MKVITEELLYLKLLKNHKVFMFCLMFIHVCIISIVCFHNVVKPQVIEHKFFCQNADSIKNLTYCLLNLIILFLLFQCLKRDKAVLSNITFYEKTEHYFILGMIMSLSILFFKFLPDFLCDNLTLSLNVCAAMTTHIFMENLILYFYIKWFKTELRNFGALIN